MYSVKEIFKQEPAAIVATLAIGNSTLIEFNVYSMTDKQLALVNAFALALLTLFYIRPSTVSKDAMSKLNSSQPPISSVVADPPPSFETVAKPLSAKQSTPVSTFQSPSTPTDTVPPSI